MKVAKKQLTGEQLKVLTADRDETLLVKGAAGCGKSLVAMYRAEFYATGNGDLFQKPKVLLVTYARTLTRDMAASIAQLNLKQSLEVYTVAQLVWRMVPKMWVNGSALDVMRPYAAKKWIADAKGSLRLSEDFLMDEFEWLQGAMITTREAYLESERRGRGQKARLLKEMRPAVWDLFEAYQAWMAEKNKYDWSCLTCMALAAMNREGSRAPYTHLVIDEAQDLTKAQLMFLRKMVGTNAIMLVADAAQQIYGSGFSWKTAGFNVHGSRSLELTQNYRNTRQIAEAANVLVANIKDGTEKEFTISKNPRREGEKPVWVKGSLDDELVERLQTILSASKTETICVALPTKALVQRYVQQLSAAELPVTDLEQAKESGIQTRLLVSTLHSMKGLEFDHVYLLQLTQKSFYPADASLDAEVATQKRKLLYVGMTRARKMLTLADEHDPSPLLSELNVADFTVETL